MIGGKSSLLLLTLIVGGIMLAVAVPAAYADENYILNQDYQRVNSNIIIHLIEINVTDKPMGNVYPSAAPSDTKWAHLVFTYENTGDQTEKGFINMEFIDSNGNTYPNTEVRDATVAPHSTTERPLFTEVPIPKNATLVKLHVYQGTNPAFHTKDQYYDLHMTEVATPTPTATAAPNNTSSGSSIFQKIINWFMPSSTPAASTTTVPSSTIGASATAVPGNTTGGSVVQNIINWFKSIFG